VDCFSFSCLKFFSFVFVFLFVYLYEDKTFKKQKTVYHYFCSIINGILIMYVLTIINGILIVYVLIQKCTPIYIYMIYNRQ